ncbi:MAG: cyclase family protein [Hyphomicrobiales bacterium]|nr:MAG: cyclase family protein [Hyphomicrobiales bacterium]
MPTEDEIKSWFSTYSNWGRWGDDDLLGTLNHITAAKRIAAAQSVEHGVTVSCAWDVSMNTANVGEHVPPQRMMVKTGLGYVDGSADPVSPAGPRSSDGSMGTASELISMVFHGRPITHLDALSHVFWRGKMYGGMPSAYVTDRDGATVHDVRSAQNGIQTRGVLLDVARVKRLKSLDTTEGVFPEDLEAAEAAQGVKVEPGDVLLLRTGDGYRRVDHTWNPDVEGQPGLHAACIPWLYERGVAAIGADGPQELNPSGYPGIALPVHSVGIVAMGLWLIDNCQLEDLAATCERYQRWHFLFSLAPLRLSGVTGSPVNPMALF